MTIRRATPLDGAAIGRISVDAWRAAYGHILPVSELAALDAAARGERWAARLAEEPCKESVWVAEVGGEPTGFVSAIDKWDEPYLGEWFVVALYVHPEAQGSGIGRKLLETARAHGRELGRERTLLSVFTENHDARAFYRRCGGEEISDGTWEWQGVPYPVVYVRFSNDL